MLHIWKVRRPGFYWCKFFSPLYKAGLVLNFLYSAYFNVIQGMCVRVCVCLEYLPFKSV